MSWGATILLVALSVLSESSFINFTTGYNIRPLLSGIRPNVIQYDKEVCMWLTIIFKVIVNLACTYCTLLTLKRGSSGSEVRRREIASLWQYLDLLDDFSYIITPGSHSWRVVVFLRYIQHIHSMIDAYRGGIGGRTVIETNALIDTKYRTWKRNADLINSLLALPKGLNDAGR